MGLLLTYINSTFSIYRIASCLEFCHRRLPVLIDLSCALSNKFTRYCKMCRGKYLSIVVWGWQLYEWCQGKMLFYRANIWQVIIHCSPTAHITQMLQALLSLSPATNSNILLFHRLFKNIKKGQHNEQLKFGNWRENN